MSFVLYPALLALLLLSIFSCASPAETDTRNRPAHHTDHGFKNLYIEDSKKSFFSFMKMKHFSSVKWADHRIDADKVPGQMIDIERITNRDQQQQITWLGHSSFLIQKAGVNLLTDPVFSDRTSPFSFMGPKRYVPHRMDYSDLPAIHHVVISHNHYDHLDTKAIRQLASQAQFHVPLELKQWFIELGVSEYKIHEYDWWQSQDISGITFKALPSQHWSGRWLTDRFASLWASWLIAFEDYQLWFAGDTGYNQRLFRELGETMTGPNLALIPIGAYAPRDFMALYHVNPEEAVRIHIDIQAKHSIGMHWGTFPLTAEPPLEPLEKLQQAKLKFDLDTAVFTTMIMGETIPLP